MNIYEPVEHAPYNRVNILRVRHPTAPPQPAASGQLSAPRACLAAPSHNGWVLAGFRAPQSMR